LGDKDMAEVIIMPKLGFNMKTGKLIKWYKEEGDEIKKGENFFQITTDKTNIDVEATKGGIVRKIIGEEGEEYEVFKPIAIIGEIEEDISHLLEGSEDEKNIEAEADRDEELESSDILVENKSEKNEEFIKISPRAKKYIDEKNIELDITQIKGTGFENGIKEADIIKYLEKNEIRVSPVAQNLANKFNINVNEVEGTGVRGKVVKEDVEKVIALRENKEKIEIVQIDDNKEISRTCKYDGVRKIIGERLARSKSEAPHVYFKNEVNMEHVIELKKQIEIKNKIKVSITDFITLAVIKSLEKYPEVNSSLMDKKIIEYKSINIGIAVAAEDGLIVPVIKNAQNKKLSSISDEIKHMVDKARQGKLLPEDYSGGTFTISNLGMFGIDEFTAVINPPEAGILAISSTKDKPIVIEKNGQKIVDIKPISNFVLTVDHRIIDGLLASQFIKSIKELLENPLELLI
jgi:pyruvate dehydrogenase E2 component (dihydrolipoamide acetyltransferase)